MLEIPEDPGSVELPIQRGRELPSTLTATVPENWKKFAISAAQKLMSSLGWSGSQKVLSVLSAALGRRINHDQSFEPKAAKILARSLPDEWLEMIRLWQLGFDSPLTAETQEQRDLFLALEIATSSYDVETDTNCGTCCGERGFAEGI